jgi:hypothetical protein
MKVHACVRGLVAAGLSVIAFIGGVGVARAQPNPVPPPPNPVINPLLPLNPGLFVDPNDEGGPPGAVGNFGRFCENWWVHCE